MMSKMVAWFAMAAVSTLLLGVAQAQVMEDHRCKRDSLGINPAKGRLDWVVAKRIKDGTGTVWTRAMADQMVHNWDWHPTLKGRPVYPTYGVPAGPQTWTYPGNWKAPTSGNSQVRTLAKGYVQNAYCTASCYKPGIRLLLPDGYKDVKMAFDKRREQIMVVDTSSNLEQLQFKAADLRSYTVSLDDVEHEIAVITTASGAVLKVTVDHPLLDGTGTIKDAALFRVGDELLRMDGTADEIVSYDVEEYFGKVYNVTPKSGKMESDQDLLSQVLVVEGFLTGSAYFQNVKLVDANRHLFRHNLPAEDLF